MRSRCSLGSARKGAVCGSVKSQNAARVLFAVLLLARDDEDRVGADRPQRGRDPANQERQVIIFDIDVFPQECQRALPRWRRRGRQDWPADRRK